MDYNSTIDLKALQSKAICPDHGFPSSSDEESAVRYREKSKRSKKNTQRRIGEVSKIIGTKNGSFKLNDPFLVPIIDDLI